MHRQLERHLAANSVRAYLVDVCHLAKFAGERKLKATDISTQDIEDMLVELNRGDVALATQGRMLSGWRMFFRMLVLDDDMKENPAELIEMPRKKQPPARVLCNDDMTPSKHFRHEPPDRPADCTIVEGCSTAAACVSASWDLKLPTSTRRAVLLVTGKATSSAVPINGRALEMMLSYIRNPHHVRIRHGERSYVFLSRVQPLTPLHLPLSERAVAAAASKSTSAPTARHSSHRAVNKRRRPCAPSRRCSATPASPHRNLHPPHQAVLRQTIEHLPIPITARSESSGENRRGK